MSFPSGVTMYKNLAVKEQIATHHLSFGNLVRLIVMLTIKVYYPQIFYYHNFFISHRFFYLILRYQLPLFEEYLSNNSIHE